MNKFWTFALTTALLSSSVFAAFIQSPIPPSSKENYLLDKDGDGRLDGIDIKLLGSISQDYLDQMVDSLTFDWVDSNDVMVHVVATKSDFKFDSATPRNVFVDLSGKQNEWLRQTAISSENYPRGLGNFKMFLARGNSYTFSAQDKMVPVINDALLRSYRGLRSDTLSMHFSEGMKVSAGCETFLMYKKADDPVERSLPIAAALWNHSATSVNIILDASLNQGERLAPRDSVRMIEKCIGDSLKNMANASSKFFAVAGYFPMEIQTSSMVVDPQTADKNTPIFQLQFQKEDAKVPNENSWGYAMDIMDEEFLNAVRSTLGLSTKVVLDPAKLLIHYNLRIYTNLGTYVVGTSFDVKGSDPRFENSGKKLFLKWNMMDAAHRRVGTGVYIADFVVHVTYNGETIYRNDIHHGPTTQIFGVKRR